MAINILINQWLKPFKNLLAFLKKSIKQSKTQKDGQGRNRTVRDQ